jgi:hypothetical protein
MFDQDLRRKEREKSHSTRYLLNTQDISPDDSSSGSEEPGPKYEYREVLLISNKDRGQSSDDSDEDGTERDTDAGDPVDPEKAQEMWGDKNNSQPKRKKEESYFHTVPRIPYGGEITFPKSGNKISLHNTCNIDNILQVIFTLYRTHDPSKEYINLLY